MRRALTLSCGGFKVAMQAYPVSVLMNAFQYQAIYGTSGGVLNALLAAQNPNQLRPLWQSINSPDAFITKKPWPLGAFYSLAPLQSTIPSYLGNKFQTACYASWVAANTFTHHLTELTYLPVSQITDVTLASCTMAPWMAPHPVQTDGKTHWGIDGWFKSPIQIPPGRWDAIDVVSAAPLYSLARSLICGLLDAINPGGTLTLYCAPERLGPSLEANPTLQRFRMKAGERALFSPKRYTL
jgi:hypothetical protein